MGDYGDRHSDSLAFKNSERATAAIDNQWPATDLISFEEYEQEKEKILAERNRLEAARDRMSLVLRAEGDEDRTKNGTDKMRYVKNCMTIVRYIRQEDTAGFVDDMPSLTYYFRNQKYGSTCFVQAVCVCISYLLQSYGNKIPPPPGTSSTTISSTRILQKTLVVIHSLAISKTMTSSIFENAPGQIPGVANLPSEMLLDD